MEYESRSSESGTGEKFSVPVESTNSSSLNFLVNFQIAQTYSTLNYKSYNFTLSTYFRIISHNCYNFLQIIKKVSEDSSSQWKIRQK